MHQKFSTTAENGKYTSIRLSGLPIGKYVAYEVTAPNGYKKDNKSNTSEKRIETGVIQMTMMWQRMKKKNKT